MAEMETTPKRLSDKTDTLAISSKRDQDICLEIVSRPRSQSWFGLHPFSDTCNSGKCYDYDI